LPLFTRTETTHPHKPPLAAFECLPCGNGSPERCSDALKPREIAHNAEVSLPPLHSLSKQTCGVLDTFRIFKFRSTKHRRNTRTDTWVILALINGKPKLSSCQFECAAWRRMKRRLKIEQRVSRTPKPNSSQLIIKY
jgi:hypothetical protein